MSIFSLTSMGALMVAAGLSVGTAALAASPTPAAPAPAPGSDRITNPVAEFAGIDKITGRIITFDVYIDETVQFGALQVTPRVCYSRPQNEEPKTDSFVEVDEITLDRKIRRIFTGWMFAESPGLNAVEHAVYDVWLKACKQKSDVPAPDSAKTDAAKPDTAQPNATAAPAAAEPEATEPPTTSTN
ncbi:DUF2155 domain-containing protein [Mesorhizobium sp. B2-4-4]|uniref:DUF2155 domain-containing protein n=1 Tax=Mesorhizobium sp. B2-4-4 TaxID=2589945 RepID=UPI00112D1D90|nr:DUF2155 domain-containing protein [Mesorhizobium sp. B2-4-4]TPL47927.1 DUF2155 domain-containing protein [Mesorhizobium sp. B2-4-4]